MTPHHNLWRDTLLLAGILFVAPLTTQVRADTPPPIDSPVAHLYIPPVPEPGEAQTYLKLMRGEKLCAASLSLQVKNATIEDIASQVQKSMASYMAATKSSPALRIEVRNVRPVRLSFSSKNSTVGAILNSSATLAGAKVWIFTDHLLVAPEEALSPQELAEKQKKLAGALSLQNPTGRFRSWFSKQSAFAYAIADDLKAIGLPGASASQTVPKTTVDIFSPEYNGASIWPQTPATEAGTQATFAQLSPESRVMVNELVDKLKDDWGKMNTPGNEVVAQLLGSVLSPTTGISIIPGNGEFGSKDEKLLRIAIPGRGQMVWTLDGSGMGIDGFDKPSPATPTTPGFLDPSAEKS